MNGARNAIQIGLTAILGWLAFYLDLVPALFASEHGFKYMAKLAPEHAWSVVFLAACNIGVLGLLSHNAAIRLSSVLVIATVHGVVAGSLLLADTSVWSGVFVIVAGMGYYLAYCHSKAGL